MKYGIATKLTKIDNDFQKLLELNNIISSNYDDDYHIIDAEKIPITNEDILNNLKKCVLTIQSKRKDAFELLDLYSSYDFDISIVLGNNYYLSDKELNTPNKIILDLINKAMDKCPNIQLWIGTEGIEKTVKPIIEENNLICYSVYGGKYPQINSKKAIYVPFVEKMNINILKSMQDYLNRRKNYNGNNWGDFILSLDNNNKLKELKNKNDIIIGYPITNKIKDIKYFLNNII